MKESEVKANIYKIDLVLNGSIATYLQTNDKIYNSSRLLNIFTNGRTKYLTTLHIQDILTNRVRSILKALRDNNISLEDYLNVARNVEVKDNDLMYVTSKQISNDDVDNFINSIKEVLNNKDKLEGGDIVEQDQSNEAKPRQ